MQKNIEDISKQIEKITITKKQIFKDKESENIYNLCKSFVGHSIEIKANFSLNQKTYNISNCNLVGDLIEEICNQFFIENIKGLEIGPKQSSPDYWTDNKNFEYELKTFSKQPYFDIANYSSYIDQLVQNNGVERKIFRTKYIIFEYDIQENKIYIKNFYFLNIWDLIGYNGKYPITIQNKRKLWYNIRPSNVKDWTNITKTPKKCINSIIESINYSPNLMKNKQLLIKSIIDQFEILENKYFF